MNLRYIFSMLLCAVSAFVANAADAPRYIFYFIGDGMGLGHIALTDAYIKRTTQRQTPLLWETFPHGGVASTWSYNSPVTDSAAAGTALSTGQKTRNNMLGMDADSVAVESIADILSAQGYGIAVISNVAADDATPGAFYAHVPSRDMALDIDRQAADSHVMFLAGSRIRGVKQQGKYTGIYEYFADRGMQPVKGVESLPLVDSRRILLTNAADTTQNNSGYVIDRPEGYNLLRDFTQAGIDHMTKYSPDKFFMVVEGGNIDWAGHDNDAATIAKEIAAYEETMRLAYDFYCKHPDETLIVVTSDHETGGLSVGRKSVGYACYPEMFNSQKISKASFSRMCESLKSRAEQITWPEMRQIMADTLGIGSAIKISDKDLKRIEESFGHTFITHDDYNNDALYHSFPEFVDTLFDVLHQRNGVGFTTTKHTGNPVGVYAIGAGSHLFSGAMDNTDIPKKIVQSTHP